VPSPAAFVARVFSPPIHLWLIRKCKWGGCWTREWRKRRSQGGGSWRMRIRVPRDLHKGHRHNLASTTCWVPGCVYRNAMVGSGEKW